MKSGKSIVKSSKYQNKSIRNENKYSKIIYISFKFLPRNASF